FGWVIFATFTGLPVSTTHAITGALTGAGLIAFGHASFRWSFLGSKFAVPLAVSPVLSLAVVYLLAWPMVYMMTRMIGMCACVVKELALAASAVAVSDGVASATTSSVAVIVDTESACAEQNPLAVAT